MDDYEEAEKELKAARLALEELQGFHRGKSEGPPYCSFCQRGKGQYDYCVEGRSGVRICDKCVVNAYLQIEEEKRSDERASSKDDK